MENAKHPTDEPSVRAVEGPRLAPNQNFEKHWSLGGSSSDETSSKILGRLECSVPGLIYISHDATRPSSVRVSGDSAKIVERVEVTTTDSGTVRVRGHGKFSGHLLTEISLQDESAVQSLASAGSGTVVVEDRVLLNNDRERKLEVKAAGSGDVFLTSSTPVQVHSMLFQRNGSGDLQLVAPAIASKGKLDVRTSGSGDVNVFANHVQVQDAVASVAGSGDIQLNIANEFETLSQFNASAAGSGAVRTFAKSLHAAKVKLQIAGSGDLALAAWQNMTAGLVKTEIAGSGDIRIGCTAGATTDEEINIAGSGDVDLGDVFATTAKVNVAGSGNVAVRVAGEAYESLFGSGNIEYVGEPPQKVHSSGFRPSHAQTYRWSKVTRPLVDSLMSKQRFPSPIPLREAAFSQIQARQDRIVNIEIHGLEDLKAAVGGLFGFSSK